MNSSISSPSPFEIPYIKNAKVVKTEKKTFFHNNFYNYIQPLSFENEPYSLETFPLIREHLDTYLFYIRHRSTTASTENPSFQITFPQQETSSIQTYRRTINPFNLQIPIKEVFYHYFKDITLNEQTIPQNKVISLFLRKNFRFDYRLLWSEQDQPAFVAFHNHFTADECLPFIISKQNEHPYFFKPDKVTQQTMDLISFDPCLNTENNFHDDNRPYRYEQNIQEQQNLFTNHDNNKEEDGNNN